MVRLDKPNQFVESNQLILNILNGSGAAETCSISAKVPPNCIAVLLTVKRYGGTGTLILYPCSGTQSITKTAAQFDLLLPIVNQEIKEECGTATDDFTICCTGYIIEGELKT